MYNQNNKQLDQVLDWSETFSIPVNSKIELPSSKRIELAFKLIREELKESEQAVLDLQIYLAVCKDKDIEADKEKVIELWKDIVDGFNDVLWLVLRGKMELGIHNIMDQTFQNVYDSNMSKLCDTEEQAQETVDLYKETENLDTYYAPVKNGKFAVLRTEDNKILKNKYWTTPDNAHIKVLKENMD